MRRSNLLLTLAAAVAQGAMFAAVTHVLSQRGQRHSGPAAGSDRLEAVERRLSALERLLQDSSAKAPMPAAGAGAGAVASSATGEPDDLAALLVRAPSERHTGGNGSELPPDEFPRVRPAASYLDEGGVYFEVGNYERAIDRFARAIELQPDLCPAYFNRALALARIGRIEDALNDYDRAAALAPEDADIFNNRGLLRFERDELSAAAADFERAIELQPDDADARANLALVRRQLMSG